MKMGKFVMLAAALAVSITTVWAAGPRETLKADAGWRFAAGEQTGAEKPAFDDQSWRQVELPHDWSIEKAADPKAPSAGGGGYAQTGVVWYRRAFTAPAAWQGRQVSVEFDGVAHGATVYLNGEKLGEHPYAYTGFRFDLTGKLKLGAQNLLAVRVDTADQPASRWYEGTGIYRHVRLVVTAPLHVAPWGVFAHTLELNPAEARVAVKTHVENSSAQSAEATVETALVDASGKVVATGKTALKLDAGAASDADQTLTVSKPQAWSPEHPSLYRVQTSILVGGKPVDRTETPFGIRTLAWSMAEGLKLNGQAIHLLGGSVHHDNGPLGAAAFDRAEQRRVELLKAAGFNAVRTAHNPPSPAFLDACDRLGLLVLDEPFDVWTVKKVKFDYARLFNDWWQRDLDAMVLRDRNHPAIVMFGIGNEIPEVWSGGGTPIAAKLAARVRELDGTRPVTEAFPGATFTPATDGAMANLDISGYNYNILENGPKDHLRVPTRIMVTTESMPASVFALWKNWQDKPWILGEFEWTSMDYLGESGIGAWMESDEKLAKTAAGMSKMIGAGLAAMGADGKNPFEAMAEPKPDQKPDPMTQLFMHGYPWHAANSGDLDLTGVRKPQSYYREIVWHGGDRVHLSVRMPEPEGKKIVALEELWSWYPQLESWNWPGEEGKPLTVEVYSGADSVRLYLNGKLLGEKPTGPDQARKAEFEVPYQPGELKVEGLNGGKVVATDKLETAGKPVRLTLKTDHPRIAADGQDLAFVTVEARDEKGRLVPMATDEVDFELAGPGTLAAVGNGDGQSTESYQGNTRALFHGRALAVVRAGHQTGTIRLKARAAGLTMAEAEITAVQPAATDEADLK